MTCELVVYSLLVIVTADQILLRSCRGPSSEVGRLPLRSGALGAVADRLEARAGPGQLRTASRLLKIVDVVGDSLLKIRVSTF